MGPALIDLSKDPAEEKDLASEYPEKVKELKKMAIQLLSLEIEETQFLLVDRSTPRSKHEGSFWLK